MFVLIHARIYDYHQYIDDGYMLFDDKIIDIGLMSNYHDQLDATVIDCKGAFVLPGMVSGHTHLYSAFARGMSVSFNPKSFLDILKQLWWKMDHFLDKEMIKASSLVGGLDQLLSGTTTLIDHHASFVIEDSLSIIYQSLVKDIGLRCVLAFETSDRFDVEAAIKENDRFLTSNTRDAAGLFGMHASMSLSDETLNKIKEVLNGEGIHIHVAESQMDEAKCLKQYGKRVIERLDDFDLINQNSLLVHCTHIDDMEMDIIKQKGATIAINPTSNLNNAVGIAKVKKMMDKGIRVIVGNDGLIQSQPLEYMNTYYLSHHDNQSATGFSLNDVKQLINNTYAFTNERLKTDLGRFRQGSEADILVLPYNAMTSITQDNIFGHIFFGVFPSFKPEKVFAKGKLLIDHYQLVKNYKEAYQNAHDLANKLWTLIKKEGEDLEFKDEF